MNTQTYAFTPANDLAKIISAAIITKADGIAILQARKERKDAKGKPFAGKSASLLASLLGIAPPAKPEAPTDEAAYVAKITNWSKAQINASLAKVHLSWKKTALTSELASRSNLRTDHSTAEKIVATVEAKADRLTKLLSGLGLSDREIAGMVNAII